MAGDAKPTVEEAVERLDYREIWLEPGCEGCLERSWCSENQWDVCEECGTASTRYVRADLYDALVSRIKELEGALRPFADLAGALNVSTDDNRSLADAIDMIAGRYRHVTAGDLRAAARVITEEG